MEWMKRMGLLLIGSALLVGGCQANPSPQTTAGVTVQTQGGGTGAPRTEGAALTQPKTSDVPSTPSEEPADFILGNLNRNHSNEGLYLESEEWVWFSQAPDYELKRMRMDGSGVMTMGISFVKSLNRASGALYFVQGTSEENAGLIFRMGLDGSGLEQISPTRVNHMASCLTINDWIYFVNLEDGNRLYRMNTDGSGVTKLSDEQTSRLNAAAGWIFYLVHPKGSGSDPPPTELHRMRLDGSEDTILTQTGFGILLAHEGWLYYLDQADRLHRMTYDGSGDELVIDHPIYGLSANGDTLYYPDGETGRLMSAHLDGTYAKPMLDFATGSAQIGGDWVYTRDNSGRPYRVRKDGTKYEAAYDLAMVTPDPAGTPVSQGLGVTNANLNGDALFVWDGAWLYQSETSFDGGIIRMKMDGSQRSVILDQGGKLLNLVGDWLYFKDDSAYGSIARIRTDGTGYGVVHDESIGELIVRDNWIYFSKGTADPSLWKIHTDGTGLTLLLDSSVTRLYLEGDWLYFSGYSGDAGATTGISRIRVDGSARENLYDGPITTMAVSEDFIFYGFAGDAKDPMDLYRMQLDGSDRQKFLFGDQIRLCGTYEDWLYYFAGTIDPPLSRIRLDGTEQIDLTPPARTVHVHFFADQILCYDNAIQNFQWMELDGSHIRELKK